jgi:hypothetical protein
MPIHAKPLTVLTYLAGFYADEEGGMDDEYCPDCFFNE